MGIIARKGLVEKCLDFLIDMYVLRNRERVYIFISFALFNLP